MLVAETSARLLVRTPLTCRSNVFLSTHNYTQASQVRSLLLQHMLLFPHSIDLTNKREQRRERFGLYSKHILHGIRAKTADGRNQTERRSLAKRRDRDRLTEENCAGGIYVKTSFREESRVHSCACTHTHRVWWVCY